VYGHTYVHPEVFAPHRYWDKVERGELIPVVARDGQGEVVGHIALERGPGTQVAERGEAVVLPSHRRHGLLERMTERLSEEAVSHDLQGIYAEPVTIHTYSQHNDERAGMPVCAVLLGVIGFLVIDRLGLGIEEAQHDIAIVLIGVPAMCRAMLTPYSCARSPIQSCARCSKRLRAASRKAKDGLLK